IAIVYLDAAYYRDSFKADSLNGFARLVPITFYPRSELRDVGVRRGRLDLHLSSPSPVSDTEEVPASKAQVTVAPHRLPMTIPRNGSAPAVMEATISYKGPATTLNISGPYLTYTSMPGSDSKFFV